MLNLIRKELRRYASSERKAAMQRFFKTGKGQYGEGDLFLGLNVPDTRLIAKKFKDTSLPDLKELLYSKIHEERLLALFILTHRYEKEKDAALRKAYVEFYLKHRLQVNNWDLVDQSAPRVLGLHLLSHPEERTMLYTFAKSHNLWERRIAILSTFAFLRQGQFEDTTKISESLLKDKHDLIHKAVGWMLREMGKMEEKVLLKFLDKHAKRMPRTMLRYSLERLPEKLKKKYMGR